MLFVGFEVGCLSGPHASERLARTIPFIVYFLFHLLMGLLFAFSCKHHKLQQEPQNIFQQNSDDRLQQQKLLQQMAFRFARAFGLATIIDAIFLVLYLSLRIESLRKTGYRTAYHQVSYLTHPYFVDLL